MRNERPPVSRGPDDGISMRLVKRPTYASSYYSGGFRDESLLPNIRRLATGSEEPVFDTYDSEDDPQSVMNRRVCITFYPTSYQAGRTILGTIIGWNAVFREHVIRYDNGDTYRHDLTSHRIATIRLQPKARALDAVQSAQPPVSHAPTAVSPVDAEDDVEEETDDDDTEDSPSSSAAAVASLSLPPASAAAPPANASRPPAPPGFTTANALLSQQASAADADSRSREELQAMVLRLANGGGAVLVENYEDEDDEDDRNSGGAVVEDDGAADIDEDDGYDTYIAQSSLYEALVETETDTGGDDSRDAPVPGPEASSDTGGIVIVQGEDLMN